jgi:pseudomonalisin/xanthomonalisin
VAKLVFYTGTSFDNAAVTEAFNQAVADNVAQVVNVSLGECETAAFDSGMEAADDAIFQAAVAQGQVFSVSSGDSGSFECSNKKTSGQSYPAVSPYVMAIGGTRVLTKQATVWAGETVWSCATALGCNRNVAGGAGGGVSVTEAAPPWQLASGVLGASTARGVPDISFDADPVSGALIIVDTQVFRVGGTSLAAPIFSGFWARLQSKHGNALAFPAAPIYQYGHVAADAALMFHDITVGKNGVYRAGAGWDWASGFGSLDIAKFDEFIDTHTGF